MVEAGGVGIFRAIEDTELIEKSTRSKRSRIGNCAQLERIWNAEFWPVRHSLVWKWYEDGAWLGGQSDLENSFRVADNPECVGRE